MSTQIGLCFDYESSGIIDQDRNRGESMRIKQLIYYPIKSCKGIQVESTYVDDGGLAGDRRLMIVDARGNPITQRDAPALSQIEPAVLNPQKISLSAPGLPGIIFDVRRKSDKSVVTISDKPFYAIDQGDKVASWLTEYLHRPVRLVGIGRRQQRDGMSFADYFPVVLTTQESLDELNSVLDEPMRMSRFRPNIVIEGCTASEEYGWSQITLGEVRLEITRMCDRCSVVAIDQETSQLTDSSLLALSRYKRSPENKPVFGLHAALLAPGRIDLRSGVNVEQTNSVAHRPN